MPKGFRRYSKRPREAPEATKLPTIDHSSSSCLVQISSSPLSPCFCLTFYRFATMCRAFEAVVDCFNGLLSNTHFVRLVIISHHQLPSPLPQLKPPEFDG